MSTPAHFARVGVLGVPVHAGSLTDAVDVVSTWIKDREPGYAVFRDVHGIMEARRRPDVLDAHEQAGLVACDGMPLVWAARRAGARDAERVCGHDFLMAFCARAEAEGWRSFLYGGKEGVPARVVEQLHAVFPELEIAGTYSPPFRPLTAAEDAGIIEMIDRSGADVVWVGLSTPKQELWMKEHVGRLAAPALLGVGAAFDFLAGDVRRAPQWLRRTGFEWVHRVVSEPRRLGSRYLRNNPAFVRAILFNPPRLLTDAPGHTESSTEGNISHG
jgi:N-acetylglucosaminyldiphosphoundecaprenol N-acetyl-beta-D-mannosaminyltransferase